MFKTLILSLVALALVAGEATPTVPPATQQAIDKCLDGNLASATKAYNQFQAELAKAQDKILKDLDALKVAALKKADLAAANAIEAQIAAIKEKGALADRVTAKNSGDLLGDKPALIIISAKYGIEGKQIDVTKLLRSKVANGVLNFANDDSTNGILDDPAPGATKSITIIYTLDGGKTRLTGTFPKHTPVKLGE